MIGWLWALLLSFLFLGCIQTPPELPPLPSNPYSAILAEIDIDSNASIAEDILVDESLILQASDISVNESVEILPYLGENTSNLTDESRNVSGLIFGNGQYLLTLDDVVLRPSKPGGSCAAISIYEIETGLLVGREEVCSDYDQAWPSPSGRVFRIRLIRAVPGYTHEENWAEFRIFS